MISENLGVYIIVVFFSTLSIILVWIVYQRFYRRMIDVYDLPRRVHGYSFSGVVVKVADGDGFRVVHTPLLRCCTETYLNKPTFVVRLAGIDAPEMSHFGKPAQRHAKEAKAYLERLILTKKVRIKVLSFDMYHRIIAVVHIREGLFSWKNVNIEMVKSGYACVYDRTGSEYDDMKEILIEEEKSAKAAKRGMWVDNDVQLPMDYKKEHRKK